MVNVPPFKIEKILKDSLDLIPSLSPSVKIQIMGGKVCLRCKGKTLLGLVNKIFLFKSFLTILSNVLPLHLKQTFLKVKVMEMNPDYLLKSFLLYQSTLQAGNCKVVYDV